MPVHESVEPCVLSAVTFHINSCVILIVSHLINLKHNTNSFIVLAYVVTFLIGLYCYSQDFDLTCTVL